MITRKTDMAVGVGILAGVSFLFYDTLSIPEPRFEPMGSALMPQLVLGVMAVLALIEIVQALRHRYKPDSDEAKMIEEAQTRNVPISNRGFRHGVRVRTTLTFLVLVLYTALLSFNLVNYYIATFVFSTALTAYLSDLNPKYTLIGACTVGCILGLLYLLSTTMNVILPTM